MNHRARVGILYRTPYGANKLLRGTQKVLNKDMLRHGYVVVQAMPHSMSISIHTLSKRHCCLHQLESHLEMPLQCTGWKTSPSKIEYENYLDFATQRNRPLSCTSDHSVQNRDQDEMRLVVSF